MQKLKNNYFHVVALLIASGLLLAGGIALAADSNVIVDPKDPADSTTMPQRITQRKNSLSTQITSDRKKRLIDECSVAQTGMQQVKTKDATAAKLREDVYVKLATQLSNIIDHLERQSVETKGLKTAQAAFTKAVNKYLEDAVNYKTAMDDAVIMDCEKDPIGFEATLSSARKLRQTLKSDVAKVKAATPQLKKDLNSIKDLLIKVDKSESTQ